MGGPSQSQSGQASSSPEATGKSTVKDTEQVRSQAESTLNELQAFSKSEAFVSFYEEMNAVGNDDPDAMVKIEAILDKHKSLEDDLKTKIGLSPDALRGYQGIFAMSSASSEIPYSEKFVNSAILFSALGDIIGTQSLTSQDVSFGVTSDAVSENSGKYTLNTYGIFAKDGQNAVVEFPESASTVYGLEDGGKKIVIETVDGDVRGDDHTSSEQLSIDVRNAATIVESWIVRQQGKTVPLVVKDGKITGGDISRDAREFPISDGIDLEFSGDSYNYLITGTDEKTGEKLVYDSAKGGMQQNRESPSREEKDSVKYDFNSFTKMKKAYGTNDFEDLKAFVDYLNGPEYISDAEFEVVEKNGAEYIKVADADTKIVEKELLYVSPIK